MFKRLTPVFTVERIEPCLDFWTSRLGFVKVFDSGEGDHLDFAILVRDNVEIMYRTRDSLKLDIPDLEFWPTRDSGIVYIEVGDFDEVAAALEGAEIVVPQRKTFYGQEIGIRGPAGRIVMFLSHDEAFPPMGPLTSAAAEVAAETSAAL